jgi:hypothetical protein
MATGRTRGEPPGRAHRPFMAPRDAIVLKAEPRFIDTRLFILRRTLSDSSRRNTRTVQAGLIVQRVG